MLVGEARRGGGPHSEVRGKEAQEPSRACSARSHRASHVTSNLPRHCSPLLVQARDPNPELCDSTSPEGRRPAAGLRGAWMKWACSRTRGGGVASEAPTRFQAPEQVQVRCRDRTEAVPSACRALEHDPQGVRGGDGGSER